MESSAGVLGQTRIGGTLYVALDGAVEPARVALAHGTQAGQFVVGLLESRWRIWGLTRSGTDWHFAAQGFGAGAFSWDSVAPGRYEVTARRGATVLWSESATPDANGGLEFLIPLDGIEPLSVVVTRNPELAGGSNEPH